MTREPNDRHSRLPCSRDVEGSPRLLPYDAERLRLALEGIIHEKSAQLQCLAVKMIRGMFSADTECHKLLKVFPRHRRREGIDRIIRQKRMVLEDALPRDVKAEWVRQLLREILDHPASGHWKTSKTANQMLHMIHKFLRCTGLLDHDTLEAFHVRTKKLGEDEIKTLSADFTDKLCRTGASAKRYVVVINHLFHRMWGSLRAPLPVMNKRKRVVSLEEMDDNLSRSTASSVLRREAGVEHDYFSAEELTRIREAARAGPKSVRDRLIVGILEMTGLRRTGILNLLVANVAEEGSESGRWVARQTGRTLTKGSKWFQLILPAAVRVLIEAWLNTPEAAGGRPHGPSPFLFPSAARDNGQMSTATLTRIFRAIMARAGLKGDRRAHLHAMRHSFAHTLSDQGNTSKQIATALGHRSIQVTETVYLRDTVERGCAHMALPVHWAASQREAVGPGCSATPTDKGPRSPPENSVSSRTEPEPPAISGSETVTPGGATRDDGKKKESKAGRVRARDMAAMLNRMLV